MTKRQALLEIIRVEFATEGQWTQKAMRIYCENRISFEAAQKAAAAGLKAYKANPR